MQVLSSLSSIPFYAPSAGFAPTNSADVSAIASAYQVVSATATQLYAGTAYVTSVNDNPLSASRAGNAANASLANSAWYDGTGRLISALPDSATVSAIASSYAESAASSKQDALTFGYDTANNISSIDGSAIGGQGGGGGIDSATCSAIASAYAESAVSSYVPYSSLEYNTASAISGINGSALAAGSTYSAGEGIDITDDVISVETPVDIVAGPGIVIDNPDGNTLRVSTEADAETVLWDGNGTALATTTLAESIYNFEYIRIDLFMGASNIQAKYVRVDGSPTYISTGGVTTEASTYVTYVFACSINVTNSGKTLTVPQKGNGFAVLTNGSISYFQNNNIGTVRRIVGIHRIANN